MPTVAEVISQLKALANSERLDGMQRYGMTRENRLGNSMPEMRQVAKGLGRNHTLALGLWKTGIAEARIVAGIIADPAKLTEAQMEDWVSGFNSWDVCDQVCGSVFEDSPLAWRKIVEWSMRDEEFVRRAAFALLASLSWHDKKASDKQFIDLMPVIVQAATDDRNFVKKAVNWALRNIGKRNINLNRIAIETALHIQNFDSRAARWIAADAIRELQSPAVQKKLAAHTKG